MREYIHNKCLSLLLVALCIGIAYVLYGPGQQQWQAILVAIIIFGYGHFLVGFYYQISAFFRTPYPWQKLTVFGGLTILSVGVTLLLLQYAGFAALLFSGFFYFLVHGALNEQTLLQRQSELTVPVLYFGSIAVYVLALLTYSVPDPTFFFTSNLDFVSVAESQIPFIFDTFYVSLADITHVFWGGVLLSIVMVLVAWYRYGLSHFSMILIAMYGVVTVLVVMFDAPAYIYMYLLVVGYHFATWLLFYLVSMRKRGADQLVRFILINVVAVAPFVFMGLYFMKGQSLPFMEYALNYELFMIVTYIHITTSFMNDQWFKRIEDRFFGRITVSTQS